MNAFERQVANEVVGSVRPPSSVDAMAIVRAASDSPRWRFQPMFNATRFAVAGAIVALFGGLLLAAVLTQPSEEELPAAVTHSPDPTAPDALLPGVDLVTEEVEPGVYRVVGDGVRELSRDADDEDVGGILNGNIVAGLDGSVWWLGPDGFFRIGDRTEHAWPEPADAFGVYASDDFEVAPDGTLWRSKPGYPSTNAASFDGVGWTEHSEEEWGDGIEVQPDGNVWVLRNTDNEWSSVARPTEDGWQMLPGSIRRADAFGGWPLSVVGDGEDVWLVGREGLHRHDGDGWQRQSSPFGDLEVRRADVGPDGTLWARFGRFADPKLARFDDGAWQTYTDGVPMMGDHYQGFEGWFEVAPDGSVWFNPNGDYEVTGTECDGVANFDGQSLARFLRDTCVYAMDVAPDGDVWLQAGPSPERPQTTVHTYVITAEAVAVATELAREAVTTQVTSSLLPGVDLVTEEVEPGVYRVLSDGTDNELELGAADSDYGTSLVAGQDGSVWMIDESRLFRIGTEGWIDPRGRLESADMSVAPDGTVWVRGPGPVGGSRRVSALTDGAWSHWDLPDYNTGVIDVDAAADGTVWATAIEDWAADSCAMNPSNVYGGGRLAVARLVEGQWLEEPVEPAITAEWAELVIGPNGLEFLAAGPCSPDGLRLLERHDDGWVQVSIPEADRVADWSSIWPVEVGPDGTVWTWTNLDADPWWRGSRLLRRTDDGWEIFGDEEPVPVVVGDQAWGADMAVSTDRRLWVALGDDATGGPVALDHHRETGQSVVATLDGVCPGALSFDGESWSHHLAGACVTHLSAAPNGNVWAWVEELDTAWFEDWSTADRERAARFEEADAISVPAGLYVITPMAGAATDE